MRKLLLTALLLATGVAGAAAQDRGLTWKDDRPTIVLGEDVTIGIRGRLQLDWRGFDPEVDEDTFDFRTARIGVKGDLTQHFSYEIEREINREAQFGDWKDVYLAWKSYRAVRIKGGRFKLPFGLEQNTSPTETDFAYRSLISTAIAPARDRGVMAYGQLGRVGYEFGVFDDDGDNAPLEAKRFAVKGESLKSLGPSYAGRITGDLFRLLPMPRKLKSANFGVAYTHAYVPEGLNSLTGESVFGADFFKRVYVKGRRQRIGAQFDWTPGPTGLKAEWMQAREQRLDQSNRNKDLSDFLSTGWYVSGTWFMTGEDKDDNINPRKPLFGGGLGAVELGVRYDQLELSSASKEGVAFTNPRADHLVPNADRTWTFGVSWTPIRWVRVVTNAIHETFDDLSRVPNSGVASYWSGLMRLQVVF